MNELSTDLTDLAPETLAQVEAAAAREGLSVSDYLACVLLSDAQGLALEENPRENHTLRHRIEAMERRFGLSVGGLDHALQALDGALFGLAARLDQTELAGQDAAEAVGALRTEIDGLDGSVDGLGRRLGRVEEHAAALRTAADAAETSLGTLQSRQEAAAAQFEARQDILSQRLDSVEGITVHTLRSNHELGQAQDALRSAVEHDLRTLATDFSAKLDGGVALLRQEAAAVAQDEQAALAAGLASVRDEAAAQVERAEATLGASLDALRSESLAAARQADEALAKLRGDFNALNEHLEAQISESAAETRGRMQAAFAENAARFATLSERIIETKNAAARTASQLRSQIADAEAAARTALEATAIGLRQAQASLAHDVSRANAEGRAATDALRARLDGALQEVSGEFAAGQSRLVQIEAAANANAAETRQVRAALNQSERAIGDRLDQINARIADNAVEASQAQRALADNITRVEVCTMAALETLSADLAAGDEAALRAAEASVLENAANTESALAQLHGEIADLRGKQSGAIARLQLIDRTLGNLADAGPLPLLERLTLQERTFADEIARLDRALDRPETKQAIAALGDELAALNVRVVKQDIAGTVNQQFESLRTRLAAQEAQGEEAGRRLQDITQMLGRVSAQGGEAAASSQRRVQEVEAALAELRSETAIVLTAADPRHALADLRQRLSDLEDRQAGALEALRDDIAQFADANERRLAAIEDGRSTAPLLENIASALEARLAEVENRDGAVNFDALRARMEERVLEVEHRSVRALEQVSETIAALERRFREDGLEAQSRSA